MNAKEAYRQRPEAPRIAFRLFEIIDPARWAIASAQAPGDLELEPKTFGGGNEREALH
jgi:hypothetical protein